MSVVRGRPPDLAGGIRGASSAYCSSLRACPAPKSPTKARVPAVHIANLQEGLLPPERPTSPACAPLTRAALASQTASQRSSSCRCLGTQQTRLARGGEPDVPPAPADLLGQASLGKQLVDHVLRHRLQVIGDAVCVDVLDRGGVLAADLALLAQRPEQA